MPSPKSSSLPLDKAELRRLFFKQNGMASFRAGNGTSLRVLVEHHCSFAEVSTLMFGDEPPRRYEPDYIDYRLFPFRFAGEWYAAVVASINGNWRDERVVIDPFPVTTLSALPLFPEET